MYDNELKAIPCTCGHSVVFACDTHLFLGPRVSTTIMCHNCKRKVTRLTHDGAIKAWNKALIADLKKRGKL